MIASSVKSCLFNEDSVMTQITVLNALSDTTKIKITHDIQRIFDLQAGEVLSTNYRKLKEKFNFKKHKDFSEFIRKNNFLVAQTEIAFTHFDIDKSFLNSLKTTLGNDVVEEIKLKPSAKILFDAPLKISSHLIIIKNIEIKKY